MNELMTALETMITRIVKDQLLAAPVSVSTANFTVAMKEAMRTYPDDIKTVLAEIAPPVAISDVAFRAAFLKLLSEDSHELNVYIRDTVTEDSFIHDYIVELAQDARYDDLTDKVHEIVNNMSWTTTVD